jgi:hypothetical protein
LSKVGDDGEGYVFDTTRCNVANSAIDGGAAIFGEHYAADVEEAGQPKECAEVLRVLDLVECEPEVARGRAGLQELVERDWGGRFDERRAGADAFGFATRPATVVRRCDSDGDGFVPGCFCERVPWFGGLRRLEAK